MPDDSIVEELRRYGTAVRDSVAPVSASELRDLRSWDPDTWSDDVSFAEPPTRLDPTAPVSGRWTGKHLALVAAVTVLVAGIAGLTLASRDTDDDGEVATEVPSESAHLAATYLPPGYRFLEATTDLSGYLSTEILESPAQVVLYGVDNAETPLVASVAVPLQGAPYQGLAMLLAQGDTFPDGQLPEMIEPEQVTVAGHDAALAEGTQGQIAVSWADGDQGIGLVGIGLDRATLLELAQHTAMNGDGQASIGAGLPAGMTELGAAPMADAWGASGSALMSPEATGVIYEKNAMLPPLVLSMAPGHPLSIEYLRIMVPNARTVTLRGTTGLITEDAPDEYAITWIEPDGTVVKISANGLALDEIIKTAEELEVLNQTEWDALLDRPSDTNTELGATGNAEGEVLAGTTGDEQWRVHASMIDAGEGPILNLDFVMTPENSTSNQIDPAAPLTAFVVRLTDQLVLVYGATSLDAAEMTMTVDGAKTPFPPPQPLDGYGTFPVAFFAYVVPTGDTDLTIIATDADGNELGNISVPVPDA